MQKKKNARIEVITIPSQIEAEFDCAFTFTFILYL